MDSDEQGKKSRERGGELGRLAARLVRNAGPRTKQFIDESRPKLDKAIKDARPKVEKAIEDYRPRVEQAGREAVRYAQDHQDEIKGLALRGARMRLGPLGMAIDALGLGAQGQQTSKPENSCAECRTDNSGSAKFCAECGAPLPRRA